jgi:hypothetical protein
MSSIQDITDIDQISTGAFSRAVSSTTGLPLARWERKARDNRCDLPLFLCPRIAHLLPCPHAHRAPACPRLPTRACNEPGTTPTPFLPPCRQATGSNGNRDRFITSQSNSSVAFHNVNNENSNPSGSNTVDADGPFKSQLAQSLFEGDDLSSKILACKQKAPKPTTGFQNDLRVLFTQNKGAPQVHTLLHLLHLAPMRSHSHHSISRAPMLPSSRPSTLSPPSARITVKLCTYSTLSFKGQAGSAPHQHHTRAHPRRAGPRRRLLPQPHGLVLGQPYGRRARPCRLHVGPC